MGLPDHGAIRRAEPTLRDNTKYQLRLSPKDGDEFTFLKRRHLLISPNKFAIQSHGKHLERLFSLLKISKALKPKSTPVHPLLDEPDSSSALDSETAGLYRSCVGILLYIASDYVECQYAIRGLAQCMSKPTTQAFLCWRHLCMYLLGCVDHCMVLTYKEHHGLLHHLEKEYTIEIYSDSDWAKHKATRKSVSSGHIFLFGNLLHSSSRSQKALALSSAEAEIYSGVSASCDGVLMVNCVRFCINSDDTAMTLCVDNTAARSFFHRCGAGRIRHISVRVLWPQAKVKSGEIKPERVSTTYNASDLGTKRLNKQRMEFLLFYCKAYDLSQSCYVGKDAADHVHQSEAVAPGIRALKSQGISNPKGMFRKIVLFNKTQNIIHM